MFSDNWFLSKNGAERAIYSNDSISRRTNYSGISHPKKAPRRMETKVILTILSWLGLTSYVAAIILNVGTWKADTLWFLAFMFGVVKFIRYTMKTWQDFRKGELEIKMQKKKIK